MVGDAAIVRTWTFDIFAVQTVNPGVHWRIQGRGQANPLIFRPNWGPKGRKKILLETSPPPPLLSQGLDSPMVFFNFRRLYFPCSLGSVLREEEKTERRKGCGLFSWTAAVNPGSISSFSEQRLVIEPTGNYPVPGVQISPRVPFALTAYDLTRSPPSERLEWQANW